MIESDVSLLVKISITFNPSIISGLNRPDGSKYLLKGLWGAAGMDMVALIHTAEGTGARYTKFL